MKKLFTVLFCMTLAAAPLVLAQDKAKAKAPTEAQKKQQERMKACNDKAGDRKGEDRKKFMSSCLKGQSAGASPAQKAQQDRMKDCNAHPRGAGDDRAAARIRQRAAAEQSGRLQETHRIRHRQMERCRGPGSL